ncbi:hypothetical protein BDW02DRAFT_592658 [Decorospora gaudefroyi]|uniref:Uncharacterized protein n=1 Tax=Decorospora gaudefroyi TaxID=184978 RepID=A0A6A5K4Y5_9PLEO|nr:hypothetical protein BDW02DRAFT_592658 [Decorospora gaudefroyi]
MTARPARWRGPVSHPTEHTTNMVSDNQPKKRSRTMLEQKVKKDTYVPNPQNFQLRFSFTSTQDDTPYQGDDQHTFNNSFSGLSMSTIADINTPTPSHQSQIEPTSAQPVQPQCTIPEFSRLPNPFELSRPQKKREGYGFSYSETFMIDSDDYPDTICGSPPREQTQHTRSPPSNPYLNWDGRDQARSASPSSDTTVVDPDFVVLRDVGSFHLARPQRILPCTRATREDTLRLKLHARSLVDKFAESADVQAQLLGRLERMVYREQQNSFSVVDGAGSIVRCALKLRDFLLRVKEDRVETGEHRAVVEHEIEWAKWLVDASDTGVMHARSEGCRCRADWGE